MSAQSEPLDRFYGVLRLVARFWIWFLFREVAVRAVDRVPPTGPVLLCVNHPNNLIDSLLVGTVLPRKVHYLANASPETLEQPAIIDPKYNELKFRGTFGDEDKGGTRLIAIGSKYFKDLPRYVPQFMVLYWRWTQDPVSLRFKEQFEKNFPIEKLKAMIDK